MAYTPTEWVSGTIISASKLNNIERGVESVNSEYTPTTWAEGDTVTAAKLNKIEQGIAAVSNDFSTAQVTVTNDYFTYFSMATILVDPQYSLEGSYGKTDGTSPFTIILYKGKAYLWLDNVESTSGSISLDPNTGLYVVTGDCSITFGEDVL